MTNDPDEIFRPPAYQPPAAAAAIPSGASSVPPLPPPAAPAAPSPPAAVVEGGNRSPRRSTGKILIGGLATVALVGAGVFAATKIGDDSAKGGAASSEEVGQQLMSALDDEDILGVIDLMLPGEQDTFRQPLLDGVDALKRITVLSDSADPADVQGLDIELDDVQVTGAAAVATDIENVRITATSTSSINGEELPLGDLLPADVFAADAAEPSAQVDVEDVDWEITTVQRDGRWYLSLFYSIAEQVRQEMASQPDVPSQGVPLRGADSPEAAVDEMAQAVTRLDVAAIIGLLNPHEAEALQRYAPLFLERAGDEVADYDAEITISNTSYTVTGSGNHRSVGIDGFTVSGGANGEAASATYEDGCLTVTAEAGDGETMSSCDGDAGIDQALESVGLDDDPTVQAWLDAIGSAFADFSPAGIAVDEVDGKWYVSPIGTSSAFLLSVLDALDSDELTAIIDTSEALFAEFRPGGSGLPGQMSEAELECAMGGPDAPDDCPANA